MNVPWPDMEKVYDKCPEFQLVVPCQCRERKSGLDITCENVETGQLQHVTTNMKRYKESQDFTVTGDNNCLLLNLFFIFAGAGNELWQQTNAK